MARAKRQVKTTVTGRLARVKGPVNQRYEFTIAPVMGVSKQGGETVTICPSYSFFLSEAKALVLSNGAGQFPMGLPLKVVGQISPNRSELLNFAKLVAVDGVDPRAWAERVGSPTVDPEVVASAQERVRKQREAEEEADMRSKAPPDAPVLFRTPQAALDGALYVLERQYRLKNPVLTKSDIFQLVAALNMLRDAAKLQ